MNGERSSQELNERLGEEFKDNLDFSLAVALGLMCGLIYFTYSYVVKDINENSKTEERDHVEPWSSSDETDKSYLPETFQSHDNSHSSAESELSHYLNLSMESHSRKSCFSSTLDENMLEPVTPLMRPAKTPLIKTVKVIQADTDIQFKFRSNVEKDLEIIPFKYNMDSTISKDETMKTIQADTESDSDCHTGCGTDCDT